jgi:hypothetical protein
MEEPAQKYNWSNTSSLRGKKLPVGEYNKRVETATGNDPTRFLKPYNKDFTQVLEVQGPNRWWIQRHYNNQC